MFFSHGRFVIVFVVTVVSLLGSTKSFRFAPSFNLQKKISTDASPSSFILSIDLPPAVIKGYKFFNSETGENMIIKGIDYYPRPNRGKLDENNLDLYGEEHRPIWERDIVQFKELGVNAIRLYSVDPDVDHTAFMCALNEAGIYVVVDVASSCPMCAVTSDAAPDCYPMEMKRRGQKVIREFSRYTNTLAFSTGNEVNHYVPLGKSPEWNAPCLKKFLRDMRAYVNHCGNNNNMRQVPVGLIIADSDRDANTNYYNCQTDPHDDLEYAQWFGINTYVYCDGDIQTYEDASGFKLLRKSFQRYHYSIPVLLTEFGCLSESFPTVDGYSAQRPFHQARWLGIPEVSDIFAGGFAFEYSIENSNARTPYPYKEYGHQNYGVGYFSPKHCDDIDVMCEYNRTPSFYNLKYAYGNVTTINVAKEANFTPDSDRLGRTECPATFPKISDFDWAADDVESLKCPLDRNARFMCFSKVEPVRRTSYSFIAVGVAGITLGIIALICVLNMNMNEETSQHLEGKTINIESSDDNDMDGGVTGEESRGLVNPNQHNQSNYKATSDS